MVICRFFQQGNCRFGGCVHSLVHSSTERLHTTTAYQAASRPIRPTRASRGKRGPGVHDHSPFQPRDDSVCSQWSWSRYLLPQTNKPQNLELQRLVPGGPGEALWVGPLSGTQKSPGFEGEWKGLEPAKQHGQSKVDDKTREENERVLIRTAGSSLRIRVKGDMPLAADFAAAEATATTEITIQVSYLTGPVLVDEMDSVPEPASVPTLEPAAPPAPRSCFKRGPRPRGPLWASSAQAPPLRSLPAMPPSSPAKVAPASSRTNCKFEHPSNRPSANPFAPLQNPLQGSSNPRGSTAADFYLNHDSIKKDLHEERPEWILSAYGPGKDAPEQLWGEMLEQSPEEMRLHAITCEAAGNLQGALSDYEMLKSKAVDKISAAYNDPDGAINYIMAALNKQPNRLSLVANNMNGEFAVGKRPVGFGANSAFSMSTANASPFGQPSATAQNANPFKSGTSGFGQPSVLGQAPSAFGQPAAMGSGTGFGQASALGQKPSAFGSPSALGTQNAFAQGAGFGQASSLGAKPNPFGPPSAFAQPPQSSQGTAFGQPSQPAPSMPFGQPSQLGATPSPFSNAANNTAASSSPFNAFGNNKSNTSGNSFPAAAPSTINAFAQPQQTSSNEVSMGSAPTPTSDAFPTAGNPAMAAGPFGQPQQTSVSAFGQPSLGNPFAQAQQPTFGQPGQQKSNPFAPATGPVSQPPPSTTAPAGPSIKGPYGPNASRQHPPYESYAAKDAANGQLRRFKDRQVVYKEIDDKPTPGVQNMDGSFTKIWFPDGPPQYYSDTEPDREYTEAEKTVWQVFQQTGKFQLLATGGGGMPLTPPVRDLVQWDF